MCAGSVVVEAMDLLHAQTDKIEEAIFFPVADSGMNSDQNR